MNKKENSNSFNKKVIFLSPNDRNNLKAVIEKIESAKTTLDIAMYRLTNIQLINEIIKFIIRKLK